jgi:hypothetical protein
MVDVAVAFSDVWRLGQQVCRHKWARGVNGAVNLFFFFLCLALNFFWVRLNALGYWRFFVGFEIWVFLVGGEMAKEEVCHCYCLGF